jgi:hypothetical protein
MKLFNKYKNKNFAFITNYINNCVNDDSLALTEEAIKKQLSGASQSSFEEFLLALTNACDTSKSYNAGILYCQNDVMLPLRQIPIPVRASLAEKAWLYYILQNSKSDLFLEMKTKQKLLSALENEIDNYRYPIKSDYVDIRSLSPDNQLVITEEFLTNFKTIVSAIKQHRRLFVTNIAFSGQIYQDQEVCPYKLEYSAQFDSFSLSCFPLDAKRPVKMNLTNLSSVKLGDEIEQYNQFLSDFEKQLKNTKERVPISIEIKNQAEAYDRCAYLFSSYDTFCYDKGNDILNMNIYYYRFQKDEIIRNILFLGHYVKVVSPKNIVDEVISEITAAYNAYH